MSTKYLDLDGLKEFYDKTGWVDIAPLFEVVERGSELKLEGGIFLHDRTPVQLPNGCASGELISIYNNAQEDGVECNASTQLHYLGNIFGYGLLDEDIYIKRNSNTTPNFKLLIRSKDYINLITEGKIQVPISKQIYNQVTDVASDKHYILNRVCEDSNPVDEYNTPEIIKNVYIQYEEGFGNTLNVSNVMLSVQGTDSMDPADRLAVTRGYVNEKNQALSSRISTNESNIDTNTQNISTHTQNISELQRGLTSLQTTVTTNITKTDANTQAISANTTKINNNTRDISANSSAIALLQTNVNAITSMTNTEIDSIFG